MARRPRQTTAPPPAVSPAAPTLDRQRAPAWLLLVLLLAHLVWINDYPHWNETNATSRLYLTLALVEDGTFAIDGCLTRYGNTADKAEANGHFYTDKAPGPSFFLVPLAWLLRQLWIPAGEFDQLAWWLRVLGLSLPVVGFWYGIWPTLARWTGGRMRDATALVLAGALGTNFLVYATHLFAHVPATMLCFLGWRVLDTAPAADQSQRRAMQQSLGGLLLGCALISDYLVVLAIPVIVCGTCQFAPPPSRRWANVARQLAAVALGALPPLISWMAYNAACFGHPLRVGFLAHSGGAYRAAYQAGWWGMQGPSLSAALGLLFSPARGLCFFAPLLVLAPWGLWRLACEPRERRTALTCAATVGAILLFATTTVDWRGGWACGPRYLVPTIPFLLVGLAGLCREPVLSSNWRACYLGLGCVGILNVWLALATSPLATDSFANPLRSLWWPMAWQGYTAAAVCGPRWDTQMAGLWYVAGALIAVTWFVLGSSGTTRQRAALAMRTVVMAAAISGLQWLYPESARSPTELQIEWANALTRMNRLSAAQAQLRTAQIVSQPDDLRASRSHAERRP